MTPATEVLSVVAATKAFGAAGQITRALDAVNLSVREGERVALLGRNGAGKTTLIRSVGSLVALDSGDIRVAGEPASRSPDYLRKLGFTLEGSRNVYWRHTPYENVRYFSRLRGGRTDREHIESLLALFEIPGGRTKEVGKLSTGNKQKVAIVCAIAHDPTLLLLDEPTLGLDVEAVRTIKRLIKGTTGSNRAFVITSHDLSFVADVCERVVILDAGRVIYDGPLSVLCASAAGYDVKVTLDGALPLDALPARWADEARAEVTRMDGKLSLAFRAPSPEHIFQAFDWLKLSQERPRVLDLDVSKSGLEAAYTNLARGARP